MKHNLWLNLSYMKEKNINLNIYLYFTCEIYVIARFSTNEQTYP